MFRHEAGAYCEQRCLLHGHAEQGRARDDLGAVDRHVGRSDCRSAGGPRR
jgi:hypothetical protein